MSYTSLVRVDNSHLIIRIPQAADYDITAPETIALALPGAAFASQSAPSLLAAGPAGRLVINASQGSSQLSGTLLADANVASIQSPVENTITITLTDVDLAPALFSDTSMQTALARALATRTDVGAASALLDVEPFGWNAIVRPGLSYDNLQFVAGTRQAVSIRIPQFAAYQIASPETVSVVLPAESLLGGITPLRAEPAFIIEAPQAGGLFGGTLLRNVGEDELRSTANYTLSVTLSGDEWASGIGQACADEADTATCVTTSMLSNLVATSSSSFGWNNIVRGRLPVSAVSLEPAVQRCARQPRKPERAPPPRVLVCPVPAAPLPLTATRGRWQAHDHLPRVPVVRDRVAGDHHAHAARDGDRQRQPHLRLARLPHPRRVGRRHHLGARARPRHRGGHPHERRDRLRDRPAQRHLRAARRPPPRRPDGDDGAPRRDALRAARAARLERGRLAYRRAEPEPRRVRRAR